MYKEEILNRLVILRGELRETQEKYRSVTNEIEELAYDLSNLENEQYRLENREIELENEIQELEKRLMDKEFEEINNALTGNKFRDAFIKCSWFCRRYDDNNAHLSYVRIEDDRLMATDGCRAIVVECDSIPEELKNTFIKWNIRDNFKDNAEIPRDRLSFIDDAIKKGKGNITFTINEKDFKEKLYYKSRNDKGYNKEYEILKFNDEKVAFNKEYLDIALKVFKNLDITVYWPKTMFSPLIIKNNNQKVVLLPVRLNTKDY